MFPFDDVITIVDMLAIGTLGTSFGETGIKIQRVAFNKIDLEIVYTKWYPFTSGLSGLTHYLAWRQKEAKAEHMNVATAILFVPEIYF